MPASHSPSTPSRAAPTLPAMALMEVLTGAAVFAAAALAFLVVLREARGDLAIARHNAAGAALAATILHEARSTWLTGPYSGERNGLSWRLACRASDQSPRLVRVTCTVTIARRGAAPMSFETAWAEPRPRFSPP